MKKIFPLASVLVLSLLAVPLTWGEANSKLAAADQKFAHKAYMGNMAEVQMGQLAEKQASSAQVKEFGQLMVKDHGDANTNLQAACKGKEITFPTDLDRMHKEHVTEMSKMQGAKFDKAYVDLMVKDHKKDVAEYREAIKDLKDPQLKAYASKTLPIIEGHLKTIQDIQKTMNGQARER